MLKINELNWTFCQFAHEDCVAQIHQGGELSIQGDFQDLYYVNILKMNADGDNLEVNPHKEIHQAVFQDLPAALNHINSQFMHWKFINVLDEASKKSGGCGSCVAH